MFRLWFHIQVYWSSRASDVSSVVVAATAAVAATVSLSKAVKNMLPHTYVVPGTGYY